HKIAATKTHNRSTSQQATHNRSSGFTPRPPFNRQCTLYKQSFVFQILYRDIKSLLQNTQGFDIKSQQTTPNRSSGFTPRNKSHLAKFREFFSINCTPRQTRVKFGHCRKNEKTTYD
ncbi:hypothetical protein, partial [Pseudoalteromonas piscicida]